MQKIWLCHVCLACSRCAMFLMNKWDQFLGVLQAYYQYLKNLSCGKAHIFRYWASKFGKIIKIRSKLWSFSDFAFCIRHESLLQHMDVDVIISLIVPSKCYKKTKKYCCCHNGSSSYKGLNMVKINSGLVFRSVIFKFCVLN